jgi:hypothetical protein
MPARTLVIVIVAAILTGCVDSERLRSSLGGPPGADPSHQTAASKVLGAIALEAVTDRKPDPARLNELH